MARKAELLEKAKKLSLKVTERNTIAEIEAAIKTADAEATVKAEPTAAKKTGLAKAGKRSAKSVEEAKEKAEKEARKESGDTTSSDGEANDQAKHGPKPIERPRIERRGKAYQKVAKLIEQGKQYSLEDAIDLATKTNPSKFDASVEIHVHLGVDPRQADQNVRSTVALPNGTGKKIRVAVYAPETEHAAAKAAGADIVADEDFLKQLEKQVLNFDVLIATPKYIPKLARYARVLGPRGLMPNPKAGTVTTDVAKAVKEAKNGRVEYRVDKESIVHLSVGKVSFGKEKLLENAKTFLDNLAAQRPASLKGVYVKTLTIATTQGPSIKVEHSL